MEQLSSAAERLAYSGHSRVAFFGGSFDPPHQGHLAVARAAQAALSLSSVLFAPVGAQPLKPRGSTASFTDRVEMTRLAIAGVPGFAVSLLDEPRPASAPNYTIDTLFRLRDELPPRGSLFCLMGADSFFSLRHWHRSAEVPFAASLIVTSRPGQPLDDLKAALPAGLTMEPVDAPCKPERPVEVITYLLQNAAGDRAPLYLLPGLHVEISASQVRDLIHNGTSSAAPEQKLLPAPVLDYIRSRGLYR